MADRKVNILKPPKSKAVGVFANAIQIRSDVGDEVLLDFLVYSETANQAEVAARIRVNKNFLVPLYQRLGAALGALVSPPQTPDETSPETSKTLH
jgi:hypothetical protein